jgi:hypothetical protein
MHTAMSRLFAMVVLLIASTFVPPSALAITCLQPQPPDGYTYCCGLKDALGNLVRGSMQITLQFGLWII